VAKKNKRKKTKQTTSPTERLLKKKANSFIKAEREYWEHRYRIEDQQKEIANILDLTVPYTIPEELSSVVWAFRDGVAFVRYHSPGKRGEVDFRSMNITLKQWGDELLVIPTPKGDISLVKAGMSNGLGSKTFIDCRINDIDIPYLDLTHAYYNKGQLSSAVEQSIIDFQLAFLGVLFREQPYLPSMQPEANDHTIVKLKEISDNFESLLNDATKEEEIQIFLKENPIILHPTAEIIPKKKLGEDFVTDFVLVCQSEQGTTYTLVEIEKVSHPILNKDYSFSSHTNHAIMQIRSWDVWLETNKDYLQRKLPGFETPKYMLIIGRGNMFDDTAKAHLRAHNRKWNDSELLTYDDVLVRFKGVISALEKTTKSSDTEE